MRFYMLSDLHLGSGFDSNILEQQLGKLCSEIRKSTTPDEILLFVFMGDLINAGDVSALEDVEYYLNHIRDNLKKYNVIFELLPGNHDILEGNTKEFDRLIGGYGVLHNFENNGAYSSVYQNVNFIFADSNIERDYRKPGKLDLMAVQNEVKENMQNLLFCHHGFNQSYGGNHDTVQEGPVVLKKLESMHISFVFHGHTHRAEATISKDGISEIGCGTFSKDTSDMKGIFNQFNVGYISDGKLIAVYRYVITDDGGGFAKQGLFPVEQSFLDPDKAIKEKYEPIQEYICRKVYPKYSLNNGYGVKEKDSLLNSLLKCRKILLLSDAGLGKSTELGNIANELCNTSSPDNPDFFPFHYQLRKYNGEKIEQLLPQDYRHLSSSKLVLILDGYDEITSDRRSSFEKEINNFSDENPLAYILISSRSNFCKTGKDNKSDKFKGFDIFDLCALTDDDIIHYLEKKNINYIQFNKEAGVAGIIELLPNPFYLVALAKYFHNDNKLPNKVELMNRLIEDSFEVDDQKSSGSLDEQYRELFALLEKIAFAMQLMQQYEFDDRREYQELFSTEERNLAKQSGLLSRKGETWQFIHNNFQEYLAAKYLARLSEEQIKFYLSSENGIKSSWLNTLYFLTGLAFDWDIIQWIAEFAPNALVKYVEPDHIAQRIRIMAFKKIFCYYEERTIWFNDELCDEMQLAHFSCNVETLDFLIDRIENPVHNISQYTAINILRYSPKLLFGKRKKILNCMLGCCNQFPNIEKKTCRLAIFGIWQLGLNTQEVTKKLMDLFGKCDSDYVRLGMYEYLIQTGEHNEYIQYFLDGLSYIRLRLDNENRIFNERYELIKGLKVMSTVDSISTVLEWYASTENITFHESETVFGYICMNAVEQYTEESAFKLFDLVYKNLIRSLKEYNHKMLRNTLEFFEQTHTLQKVIFQVIDHFSSDILYLSELFANKDVFQLIKNAYELGEFKNNKVFCDIVKYCGLDDQQYAECGDLIKKVSGEALLPEREARIDYELQRQQATQSYFDILFDSRCQNAMLAEIQLISGITEITVGELKAIEFESHSCERKLQDAIVYSYASLNMKVEDVLRNIDWERFVIQETALILQERFNKISPTTEQQEQLKQMVNNAISQNTLQNEVVVSGQQATVSHLVEDLIFMIRFFDYPQEESTLLQMTEIPASCFHHGGFAPKYDYLKSHVSLESLKHRIDINIKTKELGDILLEDHIEFCKDICYEGVTQKALEICKKNDFSLRHTALTYLYEIHGADYICDYIIPEADGDFLVEISTLCKDIPSDVLRQAMEKQYNKMPTSQLLAHLLVLGSHQAVVNYVGIVKTECCLPEKGNCVSDGPTRAFGTVHSSEFLPSLGELIEVIFDENFSDDSFYGLREALINAFINCGKTAPDDAIATIEKYRPNAGQEESNIWFCNHIIEEIKRNKRKDGDLPLSIKKVKAIL